MFTKEQLELLDALFNEEDFGAKNFIDAKTVSALRGACHSALWTTTKPIPRRDDDLIQRAIKDGRLQVCGPTKPSEPAAVSRLRPEVLRVKTGEALLAALNLRKPAPPKSLLEVPMSEIQKPDEEAA